MGCREEIVPPCSRSRVDSPKLPRRLVPGSDPGSPSPHPMERQIPSDRAPTRPCSGKRFSSSNCPTWQKVLVFAPGRGLGVAKIPAAAGAKNKLILKPSTQSSDMSLLCGCSCCLVRRQQGHGDTEHHPQRAGPRQGQPGQGGAIDSSGGRRRDRFLKVSLNELGRPVLLESMNSGAGRTGSRLPCIFPAKCLWAIYLCFLSAEWARY